MKIQLVKLALFSLGLCLPLTPCDEKRAEAMKSKKYEPFTCSEPILALRLSCLLWQLTRIGVPGYFQKPRKPAPWLGYYTHPPSLSHCLFSSNSLLPSRSGYTPLTLPPTQFPRPFITDKTPFGDFRPQRCQKASATASSPPDPEPSCDHTENNSKKRCITSCRRAVDGVVQCRVPLGLIHVIFLSTFDSSTWHLCVWLNNSAKF